MRKREMSAGSDRRPSSPASSLMMPKGVSWV